MTDLSRSRRDYIDLDTRGVDRPSSARIWNDALRRASVPLTVYSHGDGGFAGRLRANLVGDVRILTIKADAQTVIRTPKLSGGGDEAAFYKFIFHVTGRCRLEQDGRSVDLDKQALVIYDTTRPYRLDFSGPYTHHVLMIPRGAFGITPEVVARFTAVLIGVDQGAVRVLKKMVASLSSEVGALSDRLRLTIAETLIELATVVTQELAGDALTAQGSGQFAEILAFIEHHLGDASLTPQVIASAHFMSLRSLQVLFQSRNESPSSWIRKRRLENSRRDLIRTTEPISTIAARWGFPDPSTFTRAFKRGFLEAPSAYRANRH